jgi:hypothetical protein
MRPGKTDRPTPLELLDRLIQKSMEIPSLVPGLDLPCWVVPSSVYAITHNSPSLMGGYGAHRLAFMVLRGEIPEGLYLDHLCRFQPCWNPWHMDPVTPSVNTLRWYKPLDLRRAA